VVAVDDKLEVRRIECLKPNISGGPPLPVPVLEPGEDVTYGMDGSIWIYRVGK
jgi:hypothetical protein